MFPRPSAAISTKVARLLPISVVTIPTYSSGKSIVTSSKGSSWSFKITSGLDTCSSYPSRRIVSRSTAKCSSPRPITVYAPPSVSEILKPKLISFSRANRSHTCLPVTNFPSRPANGEVLGPTVIFKVGSSILVWRRASGLSVSVIVCPISILSTPAIPTISPASASFISSRLIPRAVNSFSILNVPNLAVGVT